MLLFFVSLLSKSSPVQGAFSRTRPLRRIHRDCSKSNHAYLGGGTERVPAFGQRAPSMYLAGDRVMSARPGPLSTADSKRCRRLLWNL